MVLWLKIYEMKFMKWKFWNEIYEMKILFFTNVFVGVIDGILPPFPPKKKFPYEFEAFILHVTIFKIETFRK